MKECEHYWVGGVNDNGPTNRCTLCGEEREAWRPPWSVVDDSGAVVMPDGRNHDRRRSQDSASQG